MNHPIFGPAQAGLQWLTDRVWKVEHAFERANAQTRLSKGVSLRIFAILAGLGVGFVAVAGFAVKASLVDVTAPASPISSFAGARAPLVDRNGALLAADVYVYSLFVDPTNMTASDRVLVRRSLQMLYPNLSREALDKVFSAQKPTLLLTRISEAERERLLGYGLPGITFDPQRVRGYPLGETAAHYIGMTQLGGPGLAGAERAFDSVIRAQSSADTPVQLAIDLRVQGALENELRAQAMDQRAISAVGIVTNVRTGEVIAMASYPDFDLSRAGSYSEGAKRNIAAANVYEVGSIFKLVSIAVGIDTGKASLETQYDATKPLSFGRRKIHDFHAENRVITLEEVFIASSNIGTTLVARDVGVEDMTRYYGALGLFREADIELKEAARPYLPKKWSEGQVASTSFGHGMSISALSYAEAAGAILNGGYLRPLTLRKHETGQPLSGARVLSASTSRTMLDLMRANVIKGSGKRANAPGLRVGGKTGSAEKPVRGGYDRSNLVSSFVAVFPTDGPVDGDRYLVLIMFDSPQGSPKSNGSRLGGAVAAPVAGRVIARVAPFLGVQRRDDIYAPVNWDNVPLVAEEQTGGAH